jgi:hypothetical protein
MAVLLSEANLITPLQDSITGTGGIIYMVLLTQILTIIIIPLITIITGGDPATTATRLSGIMLIILQCFHSARMVRWYGTM